MFVEKNKPIFPRKQSNWENYCPSIFFTLAHGRITTYSCIQMFGDKTLIT